MVVVQSKGAPSARRKVRASASFLGLLLCSGCATLPSNGPTARQIAKRAESNEDGVQFHIVPLSADAINTLNRQQEHSIAAATSLASLAGPPVPIALGPGDVLTISVYEVGVGLFANGRPATGDLFDPSAHSERFPNLVVSETGRIVVPYVGTLEAAGLTPGEVETAINRRLAGKSQSPQAIVTIAHNVSSSVFVIGDVNKPGRYDITYGRERLLDAIASSGGTAQSAEDTLVQFERGSHVAQQRLGGIAPGSADDLILQPGDRIQLIKRPRSFTVFGAVTRVSQVPFETGAVTLAEALARVQGPIDAQADPKAIFIFRYGAAVEAGAPVIYRLNMLEPSSYFLAQRFAMQDKDVVYIANAAANQPAKLIGLLNQLFSPLVTARAISR